ncbi:MAG: hypothetical protein IMW99_02810, partial [Firmicutes bacterium]|nr:hypothetical protein [Bacillota bacterium]
HPTGLRLSPGEFAGLIPDRAWKRRYYAHAAPYMQIWYPIETLDVAIGQGAVLATPLQMAYLYAAIANGGTFYRPYIVDSVVSPAGKVILQNKPVATGHIPWSPATRQVVYEGLQSVPTQGTAAGVFRDFPIPVSGKTGTAQISALTKDTHAWFVGFAPSDHPQIVVAAVIERGGEGGASAAAVVRKVMAAYFGLSHPLPQPPFRVAAGAGSPGSPGRSSATPSPVTNPAPAGRSAP